MAVELGAGYISTYPKLDVGKTRSETKELENHLERAGDDAGRRAGDGFAGTFGAGIKKAVGIAAAAFAGLQVFGVLKDSVGAASDLGETMSKTAQIFGQDALPDLVAFAKGADRALGQSQQSALDAAATFGVFGKSAGLTGKDLGAFAQEMVTLSSDLASFGNTSPEEAIEAIGAALRGESEPIRRYGVLLDDATLKNRALKLGLISTTKDALTPQQKVLAAQAEILAQTSDAQGDFARTSDGLANQQRILNALLENGKTQLGQALLPAVTAVVSYLVDKGIPGFFDFAGAVRDSIGEIVDSISGVAGFAETLAVELATNLFGWAEDDSRTQKMAEVFRVIQDTGAEAFFALRDGALAAKDVVVEVFDFVVAHQDAFAVAAGGIAAMAGALGGLAAVSQGVTAVSGLASSAGILGKILPILATPAGLVVVLIAGLAAAAVIAYKKFEPFRDIVDTVARTVRDVAVAAFERFKEIVETVGPVVMDVIGSIASAASTAFDAVSAAFDTVRGAVGTAVDVFSGVAQTIITALTPLVTWINDNLISTIAAISEAIGAFVGFVLDVLGPFVEAWIAILSPLIDFTSGVFQAIYDKIAEVLDLVFDVASDQLGNVIGAFQSFFETIAPLVQATWDTIVAIVRTVFGVAKDIVEGVLGSIRGAAQVFTGIFSGDWSKFWQGINTILDATLGNAVQIVARILGAVRDTVSNILSGLAGVARNALGDLGGALYQAGRDLIGGLVDGIWDSVPSVTDALGFITDKLPDWKGPKNVDMRILRPSGRWVLEGFIAGLEDITPTVKATLGDVTAAIPATVAPSLVAPTPAQPAQQGWQGPNEIVVQLDREVLGRALVRRERAFR